MKAIWNETVIAESDNTVTIEGNHYFPLDAINQQFFKESAYTSTCGWKGLANYYTITVDGKTNENAAWIYKTPKEAASEIANHVAFWQGVIISH